MEWFFHVHGGELMQNEDTLEEKKRKSIKELNNVNNNKGEIYF